MDKFFPIKTNTSCQLKWTWSTIRLYNGTTSSCHRAGSEKIEDFDAFHNTPKKLIDRQRMLDGQWPIGGCEYCQKIEESGGSSDRMLHHTIPNLVPPELEENISAVHVTPRIVEVYFNNICNMSCLYCWDGFSSKIQQENKKFGRFEQSGVVIDNFAKKVNDIDALTSKFWNWMESNHSVLRRLHILGGEPLYQEAFDHCLDFFQTHPCPKLEFNVVSNLMISSDKFQGHIDKIKQLLIGKKIKRFDLTVSIDCFGPEQEYVRYGLDLEQWKRNFEYAVSQRWIKININQTLSVLTIKTIPDLLSYINHHRKTRPIGQYFSTVVHTHEFLHPKILGAGFFDQDFSKILNQMPDGSVEREEARKYMAGLQGEINTHSRDPLQLHRLSIFLDEIDRRRNLNWQETFPWLKQEIGKNVV